MKYKAPGKCPVCSAKLDITKLSCPQCHTNIEGEFEPCEFCRLPKEELEFVKIFIKNRGSIKEVEKEMGISYPTVRAKLDAVIMSLGYDVTSSKEKAIEQAAKDEAKQKILDLLSAGEISAKEATEQIKSL